MKKKTINLMAICLNDEIKQNVKIDNKCKSEENSTKYYFLMKTKNKKKLNYVFNCIY